MPTIEPTIDPPCALAAAIKRDLRYGDSASVAAVLCALELSVIIVLLTLMAIQ